MIALRAAARSVALVATLWVLVPSGPAQAHFVGTTQVVASTGGTEEDPTLQLDIEVPLANLDQAYGTNLESDPASAVPAARALLSTVLLERMSVTGPDRTVWDTSVSAIDVGERDGLATMHATLIAPAPAGASPTRVNLRWDVINDVVYSDKAYLAKQDATGEVTLLGVLTHQQPEATIALTTQTVQAPQPPTAFGAFVATGFDHFRSGLDHQLFLCVLALGAAGLRVRVRTRLLQLGLLTLCFTLGHSTSLALATLGWVTPPPGGWNPASPSPSC